MHTVQAMFLTNPGASNLSVPSLSCGLPRARQRLQGCTTSCEPDTRFTAPAALLCFGQSSYA